MKGIIKDIVPVSFAFNSWEKDGINIYQTEKGIELSMNDFHSGTIFRGLILLDAEHKQALIEALKEGYTPTFTLFETDSRFDKEE